MITDNWVIENELLIMIAKKRHGFRRIVIENEIFNWRLHNHYIDIRPNNNQTNQLQVEFGFYDIWLYRNDKENKPEDLTPRIITPSFVRKSIEHAIDLNWDITSKHKTTELIYKNDTFSIKTYESNSI